MSEINRLMWARTADEWVLLVTLEVKHEAHFMGLDWNKVSRSIEYAKDVPGMMFVSWRWWRG